MGLMSYTALELGASYTCTTYNGLVCVKRKVMSVAVIYINHMDLVRQK